MEVLSTFSCNYEYPLSSTLSKDFLVSLIPSGYRCSANVRAAAHCVSPKSSFLNSPRGLILYLIDPIMTSDEYQRLYVIKYSDFLIRVSLFPQSSVLAFLTLFSKLSFLSGIYFSLFSILMNVLSMNKRINK